MNRKLLIAFAIVGVLVLGAASTDAFATCSNATTFNTAFGAGGDSFIQFPPDADVTIGGPNLRGHFWQPGQRANHSEVAPAGTGGCPENRYMVEGGPNQVGVYGSLGGDILGTGPCEHTGCPSGSLIILIQTKNTLGTKSYFAIGKVTEDPSGFDFSNVDPGQNWVVAESPRARVTTSGRGGTNVNVNIHLDAPSLYAHSATPSDEVSTISGYQVFRLNSNTDPGRNPAAWGAPIQTVPTTAGGADIPLVIDCSAVTTDVFLGTRAVFDGGQYASDDISQATRIECDPTLAEPRFNTIQKKNPRGATKPAPQPR